MKFKRFMAGFLSAAMVASSVHIPAIAETTEAPYKFYNPETNSITLSLEQTSTNYLAMDISVFGTEDINEFSMTATLAADNTGIYGGGTFGFSCSAYEGGWAQFDYQINYDNYDPETNSVTLTTDFTTADGIKYKPDMKDEDGDSAKFLIGYWYGSSETLDITDIKINGTSVFDAVVEYVKAKDNGTSEPNPETVGYISTYICNNGGEWNWYGGDSTLIPKFDTSTGKLAVSMDFNSMYGDTLTAPTLDWERYPEIGIEIVCTTPEKPDYYFSYSGNITDIVVEAGGTSYSIEDVPFGVLNNTYVTDDGNVQARVCLSLNEYIAKAVGIENPESEEYLAFLKTVTKVSANVEITELSLGDHIPDEPDVPTGDKFEAWMMYASDTWFPSALTNETGKEDGNNITLSWTRKNGYVNKDGTYSIGLGDFTGHALDAETGEPISFPVNAEGAVMLTVDIEGLATELGIGKGSAAYDALVDATSKDKMQIAKDAGIIISDVTLTQVLDGVVTEIAVDADKIIYGDIDGNGKLRIELYNEYGETANDKPFNPSEINFNGELICNFTITGIDDILGGAVDPDLNPETVGYISTYICNNGGEWNWYGGDSTLIPKFDTSTGKLAVSMDFNSMYGDTLTAPTLDWERYPEIGIEIVCTTPEKPDYYFSYSGNITDIVVEAGGTSYSIEDVPFGVSNSTYVTDDGNVQARVCLSLNEYIAKAVGIENPESEEYLAFLKTVTKVSANVEITELSVGEPIIIPIGYSAFYVQNRFESWEWFSGQSTTILNTNEETPIFMEIDKDISDSLTMSAEDDAYPAIGVQINNRDAEFENGVSYSKGVIKNIKVFTADNVYEVGDIPFEDTAYAELFFGYYHTNHNIEIQEEIAKAVGFETAACAEFFEFMKTITSISADVVVEELTISVKEPIAGSQIYVQQRSGAWLWFSGSYMSIYGMGDGYSIADMYFEIPTEAYDIMTPPADGEGEYPAIGVLINQFVVNEIGERIFASGTLKNIAITAGGKVYAIPDIEFNEIVEVAVASWDENAISGLSFGIVLNEYIAKAVGIENPDSEEFVDFMKTITDISVSTEISELRIMEPDEECEHDFGDWEITIPATCVDDGVKEHICKICGKVESETIPATGVHTFGEWTVTKQATCVDEGERECKCEVCGELKIDVIPATGVHTFSDEWTTDKEPTCTEDGSKAHYCIYCDEKTDITPIPATGHKFVDKVVSPTYTAKGYTLHTCSVCGYSYKDSYKDKLELNAIKGFKATARTDTTITLGWSRNSEATGYIIEQYNGSKWVRIAKITSNTTTSYKVSKLTASTRYPFRIQAYKEIGKGAVKSDYTDKLIVYTNPKKVSSFKAVSKSDSVIRLNWAKNTSATGYIIEQYKGNKWVRIAKITDNATTDLRVTGLSASTRNVFRIQAYKEFGSGAVKSAYTDKLVVYTNPKAMTGFKASAKTKNTITLSWTKNTSATGYILEQYKGNKWVRIAKIEKNTTVSYKVTGLTANTRYAFRIQAYKEFGSGAVKSAYTNKLVVYTTK